MEIDVKITRLGAPDSNVKAYVSATIGNCFAVRGMKLVEGKNGLFLSMPNYQKRDGSYTDVCFPTTAEFRQQLNNAAVAAYQLCLEKQLGQAQNATVEQSNDGSAPTMGMSM